MDQVVARGEMVTLGTRQSSPRCRTKEPRNWSKATLPGVENIQKNYFGRYPNFETCDHLQSISIIFDMMDGMSMFFDLEDL